MKILALDLGTETGYYDGSEDPQTVVFTPKHRVVEFWEWLSSRVFVDGNFNYDVIVIENAFSQKGKANEVFHDLKAVAKLVCQIADIPLYPLAPSTVKKQFTGNGHASKQEVIDKALAMGLKLPYRIMKAGPDKGKKRFNDNAADAVAVYEVFKKVEEIE